MIARADAVVESLAASLDPGNAETHARLGDSHFALRQPREAVAAYRKAVQFAPYNVEINLALANADLGKAK